MYADRLDFETAAMLSPPIPNSAQRIVTALANEAKISPLTVKNHVQKILRKLGATNRAQAVARAMTLNLLGRSLHDG